MMRCSTRSLASKSSSPTRSWRRSSLENNLIKQRSPDYNILLRDDKNYPYLQLTTSEAFPRILVARSVEKTGDFYAGPFLPAKLARRTMALSHRVFGIRSCNEVITGQRGRPCLEYDIKRCIAPCVAEICTEDQYGVAVANTRLLLEGRNDELIERLRDRMVGRHPTESDSRKPRNCEMRCARCRRFATGSRRSPVPGSAIGTYSA